VVRALNGFAAIAAIVWLGLSNPAHADTASPAAPSDQTISEDAAAVQKAGDVFGRGGYPELAKHVEALQAVMTHAPRPFVQLVVHGEAATYYGVSSTDCLGGMIQAAAAAAKGATTAKSTICVRVPYADAAMLLGSFFNETGEPKKALEVLNTGLAISPRDASLLSERGVAFVVMHDWPGALNAYNAGLAVEGLEANDRARMLRGQGMALTELKRLDEAEAAYRKSLELEPGHGGALAELRYIAKLRAGAAPTESGIMSSEESRNRH
jgi:tetratricopeptide (TPR) repeat protein